MVCLTECPCVKVGGLTTCNAMCVCSYQPAEVPPARDTPAPARAPGAAEKMRQNAERLMEESRREFEKLMAAADRAEREEMMSVCAAPTGQDAAFSQISGYISSILPSEGRSAKAPRKEAPRDEAPREAPPMKQPAHEVPPEVEGVIAAARDSVGAGPHTAP